MKYKFKKYKFDKFEVDNKEVLGQKGDFYFVVGIFEKVDPNKVRTALDKISQNIGYATYMSNLNVLVCVTDDATWKNKFNGKVPEGLEKMVYAISKNQQSKTDP